MVRLTAKRVLAIVGPTATGKSALGIAIAQRFDGEIVSCDSTAVYRGFDIGTDKVPLSEQRGIPHHMVDVVDPVEAYSAARYAREASAVIRGITLRGRLPILVGGTGLYYGWSGSRRAGDRHSCIDGWARSIRPPPGAFRFRT